VKWKFLTNSEMGFLTTSEMGFLTTSPVKLEVLTSSEMGSIQEKHLISRFVMLKP